MATIRTERIVCDVADNVAHVTFCSSEVAEYTQAERISQDITMVLEGHEFSVMILDCDALDFVTSTMLSAMVDAQKALGEQGRELRACSLNPLLLNMFETTRIDKIIPIYPDFASAIAK